MCPKKTCDYWNECNNYINSLTSIYFRLKLCKIYVERNEKRLKFCLHEYKLMKKLESYWKPEKKNLRKLIYERLTYPSKIFTPPRIQPSIYYSKFIIPANKQKDFQIQIHLIKIYPSCTLQSQLFHLSAPRIISYTHLPINTMKKHEKKEKFRYTKRYLQHRRCIHVHKTLLWIQAGRQSTQPANQPASHDPCSIRLFTARPSFKNILYAA